MAYTKQQFVEMSYQELGFLAEDLQTEQLNAGLKRLDSMMATWNARGLKLRYPIPLNPQDSTLSEQTNVPDKANEAIYVNLAVRLAPSVGKVVTPELRTNANSTYNDLIRALVGVEEVELSVVPTGAGNKEASTYARFITPKDTDIQLGDNTDLEFK
jgi:hypothetical protein